VTLRVLERLFAATALFLASSALFPLLRGVGNGTTAVQAPEGARLAALSLAVYAVAGFLLFRRRTAMVELLAANKLLFSLAGLALFSITWSSSPRTTARDALLLVLTMLLGVYLATAFRPAELASVVAWLLAGLVVMSAVFAVLQPRYGLDHLRGNTWRGVFTTKNELGRFAVLSTAVWLVRAACRCGNLLVSLTLAGVSVLALDRSGSKTGLVVLGLVALFLAVLPALRAHSSIAVPTGAALGAAGILGAGWLVGHSDAVLQTVGGDSTLTGRSEIWSAVWQMISVHPWRGWGFDAFWRGIDGPSAQVWAMVGATPPHSHNGVLDLWLDLGAVGVLVFLGSFLVATARAARALRGGWSLQSVLPATYLVFFALYNVSESTLLQQHSLFWVLYTAVAVQLAEPARRRVPVECQASVSFAGLEVATASRAAKEGGQ
jgi:O-antigen ligase